MESEHQVTPVNGRSASPERPEISVILPTFGREEVLIDTLNALRILPPENKEILVIDQTPEHGDTVEKQLHDWAQDETIRWVRLSKPSIPAAMNRGAKAAISDFVLYLDDDIVPDRQLLLAHISAQKERRADLIAGRVLQPWDSDETPETLFASKKGVFVSEFMGGNFSISRELLQEMGGFDENFRGAAYRFEKEFADRLLERGGTIWFEPAALIHHLHYSSGGTRSHGDHLHSWNPRHPVGAYYYFLISSRVTGKWKKIGLRFFHSVKTRHHLKKPWYIPVTLVSEFSAFIWALRLRVSGPLLPLKKKS